MQGPQLSLQFTGDGAHNRRVLKDIKGWNATKNLSRETERGPLMKKSGQLIILFHCYFLLSAIHLLSVLLFPQGYT